MFGYILANRDALTEEQQGRYRALYCALCRTLGKEYGTLAKLSLSYDMVMLILMLNGMYEPGEEGESFVCPVHPFKKRQGIKTEYTGYAADMTVILAYEKMLDDCADENSPISHAGERALRAAYAKAAERQKDKAQEIAARLRELYAAEREQRGIDDLANLFGGVLGEVFGEAVCVSLVRLLADLFMCWMPMPILKRIKRRAGSTHLRAMPTRAFCRCSWARYRRYLRGCPFCRMQRSSAI